MKIIKLITEVESLCLIEGEHNEKELKNIFLDPNIRSLCDAIANSIIRHKLYKPHIYRFSIQVHAEEQYNES